MLKIAVKIAVEYDVSLKKNVMKWYRNTTLLYTPEAYIYPVFVACSRLRQLDSEDTLYVH